MNMMAENLQAPGLIAGEDYYLSGVGIGKFVKTYEADEKLPREAHMEQDDLPVHKFTIDTVYARSGGAYFVKAEEARAGRYIHPIPTGPELEAVLRMMMEPPSTDTPEYRRGRDLDWKHRTGSMFDLAKAISNVRAGIKSEMFSNAVSSVSFVLAYTLKSLPDAAADYLQAMLSMKEWPAGLKRVPFDIRSMGAIVAHHKKGLPFTGAFVAMVRGQAQPGAIEAAMAAAVAAPAAAGPARAPAPANETPAVKVNRSAYFNKDCPLYLHLKGQLGAGTFAARFVEAAVGITEQGEVQDVAFLLTSSETAHAQPEFRQKAMRHILSKIALGMSTKKTLLEADREPFAAMMARVNAQYKPPASLEYKPEVAAAPAFASVLPGMNLQGLKRGDSFLRLSGMHTQLSQIYGNNRLVLNMMNVAQSLSFSQGDVIDMLRLFVANEQIPAKDIAVERNVEARSGGKPQMWREAEVRTHFEKRLTRILHAVADEGRLAETDRAAVAVAYTRIDSSMEVPADLHFGPKSARSADRLAEPAPAPARAAAPAGVPARPPFPSTAPARAPFPAPAPAAPYQGGVFNKGTQLYLQLRAAYGDKPHIMKFVDAAAGHLTVEAIGDFRALVDSYDPSFINRVLIKKNAARSFDTKGAQWTADTLRAYYREMLIVMVTRMEGQGGLQESDAAGIDRVFAKLDPEFRLPRALSPEPSSMAAAASPAAAPPAPSRAPAPSADADEDTRFTEESGIFRRLLRRGLNDTGLKIIRMAIGRIDEDEAQDLETLLTSQGSLDLASIAGDCNEDEQDGRTDWTVEDVAGHFRSLLGVAVRRLDDENKLSAQDRQEIAKLYARISDDLGDSAEVFPWLADYKASTAGSEAGVANRGTGAAGNLPPLKDDIDTEEFSIHSELHDLLKTNTRHPLHHRLIDAACGVLDISEMRDLSLMFLFPFPPNLGAIVTDKNKAIRPGSRDIAWTRDSVAEYLQGMLRKLQGVLQDNGGMTEQEETQFTVFYDRVTGGAGEDVPSAPAAAAPAAAPVFAAVASALASSAAAPASAPAAAAQTLAKAGADAGQGKRFISPLGVDRTIPYISGSALHHSAVQAVTDPLDLKIVNAACGLVSQGEMLDMSRVMLSNNQYFMKDILITKNTALVHEGSSEVWSTVMLRAYLVDAMTRVVRSLSDTRQLTVADSARVRGLFEKLGAGAAPPAGLDYRQVQDAPAAAVAAAAPPAPPAPRSAAAPAPVQSPAPNGQSFRYVSDQRYIRATGMIRSQPFANGSGLHQACLASDMPPAAMKLVNQCCGLLTQGEMIDLSKLLLSEGGLNLNNIANVKNTKHEPGEPLRKWSAPDVRRYYSGLMDQALRALSTSGSLAPEDEGDIRRLYSFLGKECQPPSDIRFIVDPAASGQPAGAIGAGAQSAAPAPVPPPPANKGPATADTAPDEPTEPVRKIQYLRIESIERGEAFTRDLGIYRRLRVSVEGQLAGKMVEAMAGHATQDEAYMLSKLLLGTTPIGSARLHGIMNEEPYMNRRWGVHDARDYYGDLIHRFLRRLSEEGRLEADDKPQAVAILSRIGIGDTLASDLSFLPPQGQDAEGADFDVTGSAEKEGGMDAAFSAAARESAALPDAAPLPAAGMLPAVVAGEAASSADTLPARIDAPAIAESFSVAVLRTSGGQLSTMVRNELAHLQGQPSHIEAMPIAMMAADRLSPIAFCVFSAMTLRPDKLTPEQIEGEYGVPAEQVDGIFNMAAVAVTESIQQLSQSRLLQPR